MGQASSAQREPSMEEILASIRRIIEDSEAGQPEAEAETVPPRQANDDGRHPGDGAGEWRPAASEEDEEEAPLDVDREPSAAVEPDKPTPEDSHEVVAGLSRYEENASTAAIEAGARTLQASAYGNPAPAADSPARSSQLSVPPHVAEGGRSAILSEFAGRKVAAAFDELNAVLQETRRQSLDQMVEEMLRPMLREWLDDNLPTLVERLVREEIERVARGG